MDDSIRLRRFQRTLTGAAVKWYIELLRNFVFYFNYLSMAFLMHFQLPIQYETSTELLNSLRKSSCTHISNHIHDWRHWIWLIEHLILDQILVDWFTKSLLPPISRDVSMGNIVVEEKTISHA
jgi:hypothetical protein